MTLSRRVRLTLSALLVVAGIAVQAYAFFGAYVGRGISKHYFPDQTPPPVLSRELLIATGVAALLFVCAALLALGVNRSRPPSAPQGTRHE